LHCEKTSFILWAGTFGIAFLVIDQLTSSINVIADRTLTLFIVGVFGFGALGSLYYRIRKKKKPYWAIWGTQ